MDLHVKSHGGAACRVACCAAVVPTVRCAQCLQLEESALLWKVSVGIRLQRPQRRGEGSLLALGYDLGLMGSELGPELASSYWESQG